MCKAYLICIQNWLKIVTSNCVKSVTQILLGKMKNILHTNSVTFCDTFNQSIECIFRHLTVTNCSTSRLLSPWHHGLMVKIWWILDTKLGNELVDYARLKCQSFQFHTRVWLLGECSQNNYSSIKVIMRSSSIYILLLVYFCILKVFKVFDFALDLNDNLENYVANI